jgi:hypothetical protein
MAIARQLLNVNVTSSHDTFAPKGHAMPFALGYLCFNGGLTVSSAQRIKIAVFSQGPSVPIFRGGPPAPV